jgi:DNA polymerase
MGATAAGAVFGRTMPILKSRGRALPLDPVEGAPGGVLGFVTVHPSYLLRLPDEDAKAAAFAAFVEDLRTAAGLAYAA